MKNRTLRLAATVAIALFLAASLSECAPTESNLSNAQREQAIQRLQAARELDLGNAIDPAVGPAASGDYSIRADRAEQGMNELEHGRDVSEAQIDEASFVPPKSLSPADRAELIRELQQAKNLDDRGWWDWTRDPIIAQDFSVQEKKASRAIKDLETDQQLSRSEIDEGFEVHQYH